MAMGKRLIIQSCVAAALLLLVCVAAPASFYLFSTGKQLCVPGLSIRCHETDCGNYFQRCGSTELVEVPQLKACYKGALLPASRTDLHSCPSTTIPRNSSLLRDQTRSATGLTACDCNLCTYPQSCQCLCTQGVRVESPVTCRNKRYPSLAEALATGVSARDCSEAARRPTWEMALDRVGRHYSDLSKGPTFILRGFAARLSFQPPVIADLRGTCSCYISSSCAYACEGGFRAMSEN